MELRPLALSSKPPSFRRQSASGSAGGLFGRREQAFEPLRNDEFHAEDDDERYRNPETQSDHPLLRSPRGEDDSTIIVGDSLGRKQVLPLLLLGLCVAGMNSDQNLLAPNLTAIAREFGFNDTERDQKLGGDIALAFFCLGAPVALLCGWLGDQCNRKQLFVIVTLLGEVPCLCTFWVRTYWQLFALRALTGISIGGTPPLLYSLMGDYVPASRRNLGIGIAVGQIVAGFFGASHGWRAPFLAVGAPTVALAVLVWFFVEEPQRGCQARGKAGKRGKRRGGGR